MPALFLALFGLFVCGSAYAAPILPAQDKPGSLMRYQQLVTADRRATLEVFTGKSLANDAVFSNLDACTLRQTTEDGARSMRLSTAISTCTRELGL